MKSRIFISYPRKTSSNAAIALKETLHQRGVAAFLDTTDIPVGKIFPSHIEDAIQASQIFVLFAGPAYFESWYCVQELQIVLAPFVETLQRPPEERTGLTQCLGKIIVALEPGVHQSPYLQNLPPFVKTTNWPTAGETKVLADLVLARLEENTQILSQGSAFSVSDSHEAALPPPGDLTGIPTYPRKLVQSVGNEFVGRENELWLVHYYLRTVTGAGQQMASVVVLEGGGGLGKTRLLTEYVQRYGAEFPDGIFWIDASNASGLEEQLHGVLSALDTSAPNFSAFTNAGRSAYLEVEKFFREKFLARHVLFVLDNVPDSGPAEPLTKWCPAIGAASILVSSRRTISLVSGHAEHSIRVEHLERPASVRLLTSRLGPEHVGLLTYEQWNKICIWVGDAPLALELLNKGLRSKAHAAAELLKRVEGTESVKVLENTYEALRSQIPENSLRGVLDAFLASYESLSEQGRTGARLIAHLAPAPIPFDLARKLLTESQRVELTTRSFILPSTLDQVDVFGRMHRLLSDFVRHTRDRHGIWTDLRERVEGLKKRNISLENKRSLRSACAAFIEVLPVNEQDLLGSKFFLACIPHFEWLMHLFFMEYPQLYKQEGGDSLTRAFAKLLDKLHSTSPVMYGPDSPLRKLIGKLHPDQSHLHIETYEKAQLITDLFDRGVPKGEFRLETIDFSSDTNEDKNVKAMGDHIPRMREVADQRRRHLPPGHKNTLFVLFHLSLAYIFLKDFQNARPVCEELAVNCERTFGLKDPNTTVAGWHLYYVLTALGEYEQAATAKIHYLSWLGTYVGKLDKRQRNIRKMAGLDPQNPGLPANAIMNVSRRSMLEFVKGNYAAAESELTRAMENGLKTEILVAMRAMCRSSMKDYQGALDDNTWCIEHGIARASAYRNRAKIFKTLENFPAAIQDLTASMTACDGDEEREETLLERARVFRMAERFEESIADFDRVLEIRKKDPDILAEKGNTFRLMDRNEEAVKILTESLDLQPDDPWTLKRRGLAFNALNRYQEALADYDKILQTGEKSAEILAEKGINLALLSRFDEAIPVLTESLALEPDGLIALKARAWANRHSQRYQEAIDDYDRLLKLQEKAPDTLKDKGIVLYLAERYEEALAAFCEFLAARPDDAEILERRADTLLALDRYEEAVSGYDQVLSSSPRQYLPLSNRGNALRLLQRYEEAVQNLTEALELEPENRWALDKRALTLRELNRYDEAIADYDRILQLKGDDFNALADRGNTLRLARRYDEAIQYLTRALALESDNTWALDKRALALFNLKRYEEALADYDQILRVKPEDANALANKGNTLRAMKRYEEAIQSLTKALQFQPEDTWDLRKRALAFFEWQRYEEALADYDRILRIKPQDADALAERGNTLRMMKRYEEAIQVLTESLAIQPDDTWTLNKRGVALCAAKRYEDAIDDYTHILRLKPNDSDALGYRGDCCRRLKRNEDALKDLSQAIALEPEDTWNYKVRGLVYTDLRRFAEAITDFDSALTLKPSDADALAYRGNTLRMMGRYEEALNNLDQSVYLNGADSWNRGCRVRLFLETGAYDRALSDLELVLKEVPDEPWYWFERSLVYHALGQTTESERDLAHAIELAPDPAIRTVGQEQLNYSMYLAFSQKFTEAENLALETASWAPLSVIQTALESMQLIFKLDHTLDAFQALITKVEAIYRQRTIPK